MKTKTILTTLMLAALALVAIPSAQANADANVELLGPGGGNDCNGNIDSDCTCGENVQNCNRGEHCGRYVDTDTDDRTDGYCIDGSQLQLAFA